jgi:putative hydrolase of the HAD superfamily
MVDGFLRGTRRDARERALELLYEAELKDLAPTAVLETLPVVPDPFAATLVTGVEANTGEIDAVLERFARRWSVERMPAIDRAVLRMGVFELAHLPATPTGVVIAEAVGLAKQFSTEDSARFINGMLGRIAEELRPADRIEVLLVDVDGVIRHWDADALSRGEADLGLAPGTVGAAASDEELLTAALTGLITDDEWRAAVGDRVAAEQGVASEAVGALLANLPWRVDEDVCSLLDEVRGRVRVALFSNATTRLEDDMAACGVAERVDVVLNSCRLGLRKPDPAAFEAAAAALDVAPARCLFVDDSAANVDGARAAGMRAELFIDAAGLADLLRRLDI